MLENIVRIENLSHRYSKAWAIRNINLEINKTGILGLLGSNGAGKSTTMNILCGVLNQTEGNVFIGGINIRENPREAKKQIGFLPQHPPLHLELTVDEYLTHCAHLRLIDKDKVKQAVEDAKARCGVSHFSTRLLRNLSGGYRQRVGIAQAIIHKPQLVVLDEPTNGLDPNQILEVRSLIKEIAEERAVIFSTHILSEVQVLCRDIKMIEKGRVVFSDTMEAFNNYIEPNGVMIWLGKAPHKEEFLAIPGVTGVEYLTANQVRLRINSTPDICERLIELSVTRGWQMREISLEKSSLDDVFKQLSSN